MSYRVIQWATGNVGRAAIEGVAAHPQLERVGGWVASDATAGRDAAQVALACPVFTIVGDSEAERDEWRKRARFQIAFYGSTRTYANVFELHGWPGTSEKLHDLQRKGDMQGMAETITDEMLEEWAVVATYDRLADQMRNKADGLFRTVTLTLLDEARRDVDLMRDTIRRLHQG